MDSLNSASLGLDQSLGTFFGTSATLHEGQDQGLGFFDAVVSSIGYIPGDIAALFTSLS
ncbi:hypothetical protein [Dietzia timorensis]|uniref:hypothetical protein n=1 Tax=Dietzia timorensis TaxID=499555 RepID=UPI0012E88D62|nr:hypothetical protein [Dietzia timorensis]